MTKQLAMTNGTVQHSIDSIDLTVEADCLEVVVMVWAYLLGCLRTKAGSNH